MKLCRTLGISLVIGLVLVIAVGGNALALVEQLNLEELTAKADAILVGEVTDIAYYEEGKGDIYTMVTLSVEQTIKGESEGEVTIKVPGGEVDGLQLWVEDVPSFQLGERAFVFLEEADNALRVSGWYQGKFTVENTRVLERDQSLTSFMADICRIMEAQDGRPEKGISGRISVRQFDKLLENPIQSKVESAKTGESLTGWQDIMTDDFEGTFPGVWATSVNPGATDAYWGKDGYRSNGGSYSAFCAKNGTAGVNPPANYPNNMDAWMEYGPFSLADATDAKVDFWLWYDSESGYDWAACMASINGTNYSGIGWSGNSGGWVSKSLDLKDVGSLGNLCGQPEVWIAFIFQSDSTNTDYGAFVDDVVVQKYIVEGPVPQITSISPDTGSGGTGFEVTITGTDFGSTQATSTVTFWRGGGYPASEATIVSWTDTQIVCEVPGTSSGSTSNGVKVTTSAGPSNNYPFTATFSYAGDKWGGTDPMGETILINPNTADCIGERRAFIDAIQSWNDVDTANFYFEYGGLTSATDKSMNGLNEIMWVNYDTGSIATCSVWASGGTINECDVRFNDLSLDWDTSGSPLESQMDVQNIAVHELGHWLCLLDLYGDPDSAKTMYGFGGNGEIEARTLEPQDEAGIQWIYPGAGTRGQYHLAVTNTDNDNLTVYFKSDIDSTYDYNYDVPSGQTLTSWWEVVPNGSHQVSIKWTDPDKGTEDILNSAWLDVPIEGDTEFAFTIPPFPPSAEPTITSVTPNSGNQEDTLNATVAGTNFTGATTVSFGADITVNSFTVDSDIQITANITIAGGATLGTRNVSVTTAQGTGTLTDGFTVTTDITPPTMEPIVEPEGQYYNTAPSFSNFGFGDNLALDDGWYQMDSYAGSWTALFTDASGTSWDDDGWIIPGFDALAEGSHTIYFKASDDAGNVEGESGEWAWQFFKDDTPPTVTVEVNSGNTINLIPGGSQSGIPLDINGIPDLGAGNGVGGFTFDLSWDENVIHVDSVTAATIGGFPITAGTPNNTTGEVTITGFSFGSYLTENTTVATLEISAMGNTGDTTSIDVSITNLGDKDANPIPVTPVNAPVAIINLMAETSISQAEDNDGVVVIVVNIDRIKDPSNELTAEIPGGIGSYTATASASLHVDITSPDIPEGIECLDVRGVSPFDDPTFDPITCIFSVSSVSSPLQPNNTPVAKVIPKLIGDCHTAYDGTIAFQIIGAASGPEMNVPEENPNSITFLRGDSSKNGVVDIFDAMFIAQYVVGQRTLDELNALNAASVKHDDEINDGDKIDIFDAMFIAQYVVGSRNAYFDN